MATPLPLLIATYFDVIAGAVRAASAAVSRGDLNALDVELTNIEANTRRVRLLIEHGVDRAAEILQNERQG